MQHIPDYKRPKSGAECRTANEARDEVDRLLEEKVGDKRSRTASEDGLRSCRKELAGLKKERRQLKKEVDVITKYQAAADALKSTSGWSAAAIGCCTLLWSAFDHYGSPFPEFLLESEVFYGGVCWVATTLFAWMARNYYEA